MPDPLQKLPPLLEIINTLILQQLQVSLAVLPEGALQVLGSLGPLKLESNGAPAITFETIEARVAQLRLPSPEHPDLLAVLTLDRLDQVVHPEFFERAAVLARQALVKNFSALVDRVEVREARLTVRLRPDRLADIRVEMASCRVRSGEQLMAEVLTPRLDVLGFDLKEADKKKALARAQVRVQSLQVRVPSESFQMGWEAVKSKVPSAAKLNKLNIRLHEGSIKVVARSGWLPMDIPVEFRLDTRDNRLGVKITRVLGPARKLVLLVLDYATKKRPEIEMQNDSLWVDPFAKLPIPVEIGISRFEIDDDTLVLQLAELEPAQGAEESTVPVAAAVLPPPGKELAPPLP